MALLRCRFRPQVWQNDYAISLEFETEDAWDVEWPDDEPLPEPHSLQSDALRLSGEPPEWVLTWPGPFEIDYELVSR